MGQFRFLTRAAAIMVCAALGMSLSACGSSSKASADSASATSISDFGGMEGLVKAAQTEGNLTLIGCPDDWANWGVTIKNFEKKYGIKVKSTNPNASSAEEIKAAKDLKGQRNAPDVFDIGPAVIPSSMDVFAPYKVSSWDKIPDANKDSNGKWVNDYTGVMSIGYDSSKVPAPSSLNDLLNSDYKGKVALNGDPTQSSSAFAAVAWATLQNNGKLDDFSTGLDFFSKLQKAGSFINVRANSSTIASGETPVVIDWNYLNIAAAQQNANYKTIVLKTGAYGSYYSQAINKDAPHPAAARLWEEFVYSTDTQNEFLRSGAIPVLAKHMTDDKTIDEKALSSAGGLPETINQSTTAQVDTANKLIADRWSAISSS